MANLTTKELTALDDQIRHEQVLVKKYQAMACLCTDAKVQGDLRSIADKHQKHCDTRLGFLPEGGESMTDPNQCANLYDVKEVLGDCLSSQKQITAAYNTFAGECVDPRLRNAFLNILDEEHCIQADIFKDLNAHGWYLPEQAEQQKINQTRNQLTQG